MDDLASCLTSGGLVERGGEWMNRLGEGESCVGRFRTLSYKKAAAFYLWYVFVVSCGIKLLIPGVCFYILLQELYDQAELTLEAIFSSRRGGYLLLLRFVLSPET